MKSKQLLKGIVLLSILLVIEIYPTYRSASFPFGLQALECLVSVFILCVTFLFLWKANLRQLNYDQDRSIRLGLFFGILWTIEIGINNIIRPGLPLRDIVDNSFWVTIALLILGLSIFYARRTKKISRGIISGFWSGLASGAVACLTALLLIVFGMELILRDPLNIKEWSDVKTSSDLPGMAVYFAYQTLMGALMHLVILGVVMGLLLGFIGGILGKAFSMLRK